MLYKNTGYIREAMRALAVLGADFAVDLTEFMRANTENFVREYYSVCEIDNDGDLGWGLFTTSFEQAEKRFQELTSKKCHVVLLDMGSKELLKEYNEKEENKGG